MTQKNAVLIYLAAEAQYHANFVVSGVWLQIMTKWQFCAKFWDSDSRVPNFENMIVACQILDSDSRVPNFENLIVVCQILRIW